MAGTSVTGTGTGASRKLSINELNSIPLILVAGRMEVDDSLGSPPSDGLGTVTFRNPLPGPPSNYVVILTGIGTGAVQVAAMIPDDDGNFAGFIAVGESEGTAMYIVTRVGGYNN